VSFQEAVTTVLTKKFADFSGRARKSEWWWWFLFYTILALIVGVIDLALGTKILGYILFLALLVPGLAAAARRLHDTGRSGWWLLLIIVLVIGWVVLLVFYLQDGDPGENQYGPSPKPAEGWTPNAGPDPNWGQS
jgi:uncharacterized membrane protein YhaH (DUF805 family)